MTEHPITPPPELLEHWAVEHRVVREGAMGVEEYIAIQTSRFRQIADDELEAVCEYTQYRGLPDFAEELRAARRPKPPISAEQALDTLRSMRIESFILNKINVNKHVMDQYSVIERALERLQQLEQENHD